MSVAVTKWVWEQSESKSTTRVVALKLADNANDEGYCWPGIPYLARTCKCSERMIQRHIRTLEEAGEIETVEQMGWHFVFKGKKYRASNLYVFRQYRESIGLPAMLEGMEDVSLDSHEPSTPAGGVSDMTPIGVSPMTPQTDNGVTLATPHSQEWGDTGDTQTIINSTGEPSIKKQKNLESAHPTETAHNIDSFLAGVDSSLLIRGEHTGENYWNEVNTMIKQWGTLANVVPKSDFFQRKSARRRLMETIWKLGFDVDALEETVRRHMAGADTKPVAQNLLALARHFYNLARTQQEADKGAVAQTIYNLQQATPHKAEVDSIVENLMDGEDA